MEKIMPNRLDRGFFLYQEEFEKKVIEVLHSGWYVLGLEKRYYNKVEYSIVNGAISN